MHSGELAGRTKIVYPRKRMVAAEDRSAGSRALLVPAAWIYRLVSTGQKKLKHKPVGTYGAVAIISIGNIEVGGGGKTPFCIHLLEALTREGYRPVYASRGFKSESERLGAVTVVLPKEPASVLSIEAQIRFVRRDAALLDRVVGDEGAMVAWRLPQVPLVFSSCKTKAIKAAISLFDPTHIILDDAFQSWGLYRDLDVVLLDARKPFGNGRMLPAGTLREEPSALSRADWIGFNDLPDREDLPALEESIDKATSCKKPVFGILRHACLQSPEGDPCDPIDGPIASLSSIARPDRFDQSLERCGCDVRLSIRYPDHHGYGNDDAQIVQALLREHKVAGVVTTEKDWVKLRDLESVSSTISIARLELEIAGGNIVDRIKKPQA